MLQSFKPKHGEKENEKKTSLFWLTFDGRTFDRTQCSRSLGDLPKTKSISKSSLLITWPTNSWRRSAIVIATIWSLLAVDYCWTESAHSSCPNSFNFLKFSFLKGLPPSITQAVFQGLKYQKILWWFITYQNCVITLWTLETEQNFSEKQCS